MKSRSPKNRFTLTALAAVIMPILLTACAAPGRGPGTTTVFRSDDLILHQIQPGDTLPYLAFKYLGDRDKDWLIEEQNPNSDFSSGKFITIPLKKNNIGGNYPEGIKAVPILCYHKFDRNSSSALSIPPEVFDRQMKYLKDNNYRTITPEELRRFLEFSQPIPKKSVMISIDDGYRSVYDNAFPILKKYGFTATLFIYTDYVGVSRKALSWKDLVELKDAGFSIGSHTISHCDLTSPDLGETEAEITRRLTREIAGSKKIIDRKLGQDTTILSFPYGRYNARVLEISKKAGYRLAVSVNRGNNPFFSNPYTLKRDQVLKRDLKTFVSRLKTFNMLKSR